VTELVSGRSLVAELEQLGVDPAVVRHVRLGLRVIAKEIRSWSEADNEHAGNLDEAAALVDPEGAG
jgi:hypothetical protein